jgi:hypothetical protein
MVNNNKLFSNWLGSQFEKRNYLTIPLQRLIKKYLMPRYNSVSDILTNRDLNIKGLNPVEQEIVFKLFQGIGMGDQNRMNKHLVRMYIKLMHYSIKGNREKFNTLMSVFLKHSKAFALVSIMKTYPDWPKRFRVLELIQRLEITIWNFRMLKSKFRFKRVMIPKKDGSLRPLSVPEIQSRINAKAQLILLSCWIIPQEYILPYQGGITGNSIADLWKIFLIKSKEAKYIVGFDIMKFYDSMSRVKILNCLNEIGVPILLQDWIINSLIDSNRSLKREELALEINKIIDLQKASYQNPDGSEGDRTIINRNSLWEDYEK